MKRIAIFASGGGSNARKIIEHFEENSEIDVALIVTNKRNAGVLNHAREFDIPILIIDRNFFYNSEEILQILKNEQIDLIVLAGFLWLIPSYLIQNYLDKIINIHPSLLPKYGGKGMYGINVHKAVKENHENESGITIHFVNENFDEGNHIFQASINLDENDSPEEIAKKVLTLEHKHFPLVIEKLLCE